MLEKGYASSNPISLITPRFLLRVGGLSVNIFDDLRFEQTIRWQEMLLSLEDQLASHKDCLVDRLHEAVNSHKEDQVLRRRLINLKRQIFNLHLPHGSTEGRALALKLPENDGALLHAWLDVWEQCQQQRKLGSHILNDELRQKRAQLKEILNDEDFRKGILLSSPILDQAIAGYLASDNLQLNREARTVERSLLEYLFRTVYKTSPFSTFTPVSIGHFEERGTISDGCIDLAIQSIEKHSFTRLNMIILSRISTQIQASLDVRTALRIRITNGWRLRNDHVEYIRRKPMMDVNDPDATLLLDHVEEHIIQLPVRALLQHLLAFMGDGHEEKWEDVFSHLVAFAGMGIPSQRAQRMVQEYLQHLLRLGFFVVPALQINIHHSHPLEHYCQGLRTIAAPQMQDIARLLESVALLVKRTTHLEQIKQTLQQCSHVLGVSQRALALPRTLLYEDTILRPQQLAIHQDDWQEIFADLHELQQILPVFDSQLPQTIMMRGYFQARYGDGQRCDDFFSFADRFNVEFHSPLQQDGGVNANMFDTHGNFVGRPNRFQQPEIAQLNKARQTAISSLQAAYQSLPTTCAELILDKDFLEPIVSLVPEEYTDLLSHTFFSQVARVAGVPLLTLNQLYAGMTLMFSRFAYCFADDQRTDIVPALRGLLERLKTGEVVFAELKGGYDATNLNLHPTVTPYELVCPGELSARPPQEQILLEDLSIQDDVGTGRLRLFSKKLGKEVIPLYLGFLTPDALPEVQQILLNFSYLEAASLHLWRGVQVGNATDEVTAYPRLRYKHIVLHRASWKVSAGSFPIRASGQSDADYYLAVARWRKVHHVPTKVFVTPLRSTSVEEKDEQEEKKATAVKPLCVDFESFFSILLLEASIRKTSTALNMTEMLPLPKQLWFEHDHQAYVSEFIFEVSQTKRGKHAEKMA
jgi:hypothetical protein